jgi:hypothetical protein
MSLGANVIQAGQGKTKTRLLVGQVLPEVWCPRGDSNTRHAV